MPTTMPPPGTLISRILIFAGLVLCGSVLRVAPPDAHPVTASVMPASAR